MNGKMQICAWVSLESYQRMKELTKAANRGMGSVIEDLLLTRADGMPPPPIESRTTQLENKLAEIESRLANLETRCLEKVLTV